MPETTNNVVSFPVQRLTVDEQQLVEWFRDSRKPSVVLETARHYAAHYRAPATRLNLSIERFASGPRRTFWIRIPRSYHETCQGETFTTVEAVQGYALDYFDDYLRARKWDAPAPVFEHEGSGYVICYIRRGNYRLEVHGLPDWMIGAWPAGAR